MALYKAWITNFVLSRRSQIEVAQKWFAGASCYHTAVARFGSNKTSLARCGRPKFARTYPVLLVRPDGSTINIKYKEPKRILVMPVDISTLSEEERKARWRKHELRKAVDSPVVDQYEEDFKVDDYSKFWKK